MLLPERDWGGESRGCCCGSSPCSASFFYTEGSDGHQYLQAYRNVCTMLLTEKCFPKTLLLGDLKKSLPLDSLSVVHMTDVLTGSVGKLQVEVLWKFKTVREIQARGLRNHLIISTDTVFSVPPGGPCWLLGHDAKVVWFSAFASVATFPHFRVMSAEHGGVEGQNMVDFCIIRISWVGARKRKEEWW